MRSIRSTPTGGRPAGAREAGFEIPVPGRNRMAFPRARFAFAQTGQKGDGGHAAAGTGERRSPVLNIEESPVPELG